MVTKIILRNSKFEPDNGFFIRTDGTVAVHTSHDGDCVNIHLQCRGALQPHSDGKFYPVTHGSERYAPDTTQEPARYFHEYCQQNRWNGFIYHEAYTTAQLAALRDILLETCSRYGIPTAYNKNMWNVMSAAGIFADTALHRESTNVVHPQPELLTLLKSL